jgi:hypothetical protein
MESFTWTILESLLESAEVPEKEGFSRASRLPSSITDKSFKHPHKQLKTQTIYTTTA